MASEHFEVEHIKSIATKAADLIMQVYGQEDFEVSIKEDENNSPLTKADKLSHQFITKELAKITPDIAIISEEDSAKHIIDPSFYWLIDPLDGTKEFIKRNDQFTINIALVKDRRPIFGLMYVPVSGDCYYTEKDKAYKQSGSEQPRQIRVSSNTYPAVILTSSSHPDEETAKMINKYPGASSIEIGSALKLCIIAEGEADLYPRYKGIMDWDIAAGDAILTYAGGKILDLSGQIIMYGAEGRKNSGFIATNGKIEPGLN